MSHAGLRTGLTGQSSGLVLHVFRLLECALKSNRPVPWVLLENVPGLLDCSPVSGPAISQIVTTFEQLGYHSWAHRVVSSASFGVPNRRRRVFVLASMYGDARDVLLSTGRIRCIGSCVELHGRTCYSCHMSSLEKIAGRGLLECDSDDEPDPRDGHGNRNLEKRPSRSNRSSECDPLKQHGPYAEDGGYETLAVARKERLKTLPSGQTQGKDLAEQCGDGSLNFPRDELDQDQGGKALHPNEFDTEAEDATNNWSFALDLGNARSPGAVDMVPTFTTNTSRICLLLSNNKMGMLRVQDAERLQGFPEGYTECCFPIAAPGAPIHRALSAGDKCGSGQKSRRDNERWKLLGNAVTVQVAEWLGRQLMEPYRHKYVPSCDDKRFDLLASDSTNETGIVDIFSGDLRARESIVVPGTWPRGAWYLKTLGRFVATVSEAPEIRPFVPLGEFVHGVGQPPDPGSLSVYVGRMREQGWDVTQTIQKAMQCGAASFLPSELEILESSVAPLSIGKLCWAKLPKWPWWPGEILDPADERPPRPIPPTALLCRPKISLPNGERYVLVIFFGDNTFHWMQESQLREFEDEADERYEEGLRATMYNRVLGTLFRSSVKEAWEAHKQSLGKTTLANQVAFRASRAAADAAAAGRGERCGCCQTCQEEKNAQQSQRRCLVRRAHAAAASGHTGAQLAVLGAECIGARVLVWWPLDSEWYAGTVSGHDAYLMKHTVDYDDGDVEHIHLWSASQTLRVLTAPSEWEKMKEELEQKRRALLEAKEKDLLDNMAEEQCREATPAPENEFEKDRLENIQRNKEALKLTMQTDEMSLSGEAEGALPLTLPQTAADLLHQNSLVDEPPMVANVRPTSCSACNEFAGKSKKKVACCCVCFQHLIHTRCLHPTELHYLQTAGEWKCVNCLTEDDFANGRFRGANLSVQGLQEFYMARKCEAEIRKASMSKRCPAEAPKVRFDPSIANGIPKRQRTKGMRHAAPLVVQTPKFLYSEVHIP